MKILKRMLMNRLFIFVASVFLLSVSVAQAVTSMLSAGPTTVSIEVFPGERLLFNVDNDGEVKAEPHGDLANLTPEGKQALINALLSLKPVN